jgi:hypothetical protein
MKRSDFITALKQYIPSEGLYASDADDLLDFILSTGMMPPNRYPWDMLVVSNDDSVTAFLDGKVVPYHRFHVYEWEPE